MDRENTSRVIDQFSAREACTVLAALRVFQQLRATGGALPPDAICAEQPHRFTLVSTINQLEHFEDATQLSDPEIDALADRIAIRWLEETGSLRTHTG